MKDFERPCERVLGEYEETGEERSVSLLEAESIAVIERSNGPVTEAAYGVAAHGHKILVDREACARAFAVETDMVSSALGRMFASGGEDGELPQLSDLMDLLDKAGERYTYVAWDEAGNVAMRRVEQGTGYRSTRPGW